MRRLIYCISFILCLLPVPIGAEAENYIFEHIQTSNHWINDIYQDKDGFIWVSTRNGLHRYLGNGTSGYETVSEGNIYYDISQDADGLIWVESRDGLQIYDPRTCALWDWPRTSAYLGTNNWVDCFEISCQNDLWWSEGNRIFVKTGTEGQNILAGECVGKVQDIFLKDSLAYALTELGSIYTYVLEDNGQIKTSPVISLTKEIEPTQVFQSLFVDSSQNIWASQGSNGVWFFRYASEQITCLTSKNQANAIQRGFISSIIEDSKGNIWLASDHGGISICDKSGKVLTRLKNNPLDVNSLASDCVYTLYCDAAGNVWVGYTKMGISVYRGENNEWTINHIRTLQENNLHDDVNSSCEDYDGFIWLGTDGYGLVKLDPHTGREVIYTRENSNLRSNVITDIHCDSRGRVWVGTFYGGLSCIEVGEIKTWTYKEGGNGLASDNVWAVDEDEAGRIWIGTLGGGVQYIDPNDGTLHTFNSENGLSNNAVLDLECADDGKVYVATGYGLSVIDPQSHSVMLSPLEELTQMSLTGILVDSSGLVWLDEDGKLKVYAPELHEVYTPVHPALNNVRSIIDGDNKSVWVITDNAICKVDAMKSAESGYAFKVVTFSFSQQTDLHFNQRSASLTSDGDFIIGSFSGYMRFRQGMFTDDDYLSDANLHFTALYVGNHKMEPGQKYGSRIILDQAVGYSENITLSHKMSIISVNFTSLDYFSVRDIPLYYRLDGLSDEWIETDRNAGRITFTNLTPGKYTLWLTPDTGDISKGISLKIKVRPPFWAAWWSVLTYFVLLSSIVIFVWKMNQRKQKEKKERLEQAIKQERRHYVDEMKMQFFTNVSHDFRTPLTLIITPIEEMLSKNPEKSKDPFIMTIHRNAQRLLNLVNEVLDLRKMEMYGTHMNISANDLVIVMKDVVESFRLMASSQGIDLKYICNIQSLVFDFDAGKVVKIITNLLSNSFKFTPSGGYVHVEMSKLSDDMVLVEVKDSGVGVADKDKRRIFDRFYQAKDSLAGSGIGLHIVREFVLLHGGDINVRDNEPSGTVLYFTLPIRTSSESQPSVDFGNEDYSCRNDNPVEGASTVLVVDDNDDFRMFMCASLSGEYNVLSASDGAEALKLIETNDVDVVVSDLMMPVMDGSEFCRRMKSDINTSHIPIILLTAKSMQDDERHGLESGADDYLTKPFNMSILRLRIAKFIEWKKRTKRMFERELEVATEQITITTMDDRLLQQAINVINENISNPDFSVSELSAALNMHRTSLYKKLLYITGKTPIEFIRSIRLKKSVNLLETEGVYISEIAYLVGFNSPKVFASHFKDEFGCSPTEWRRKKKVNDN